MKNIILNFFFILFMAVILALCIRGIPGTPTEQDLNDSKWKDEGPFELSPDRGRFALMMSVVENNSFQFSLPIARFAAPDVAYTNSHYVSLFAPGVSFLIVPGYLIGKMFGVGQVGSFAIIALFGLLNALLIRAISIRLGAHKLAATVAGLVFLFATPAFTYAVTLYQHHISTFLILLSVYVLAKWKGIWPLAIVWFLTGLSIVIDNPNIIFMMPIALFALGRFFVVYHEEHKIKIQFKVFGILTLLTALIPLTFFLLYNQAANGDYQQLSGTLTRAKAIDAKGNPTVPDIGSNIDAASYFRREAENKSVGAFFLTRNLLNGFYIHSISPDRGLIYYTPIILLAAFSFPAVRKSNSLIHVILVGVIGSIILLYSMWSDPWGGWAFGSRYLIPAYAVAAIFLSFALTVFRKNQFFQLLFIVLLFYSVCVNTLGAITTSRIPPKVETLALEKLSGREEKFSYNRTFDYIMENRSKSFAFQTFAYKHMDAWQFFIFLVMSILSVTMGILIYFWFFIKGRIKHEI